MNLDSHQLPTTEDYLKSAEIGRPSLHRHEIHTSREDGSILSSIYETRHLFTQEDVYSISLAKAAFKGAMIGGAIGALTIMPFKRFPHLTVHKIDMFVKKDTFGLPK